MCALNAVFLAISHLEFLWQTERESVDLRMKQEHIA